MYILDTSVLIEAHKHDFPIGVNPGTFWDFLEEMSKKDAVKIAESVFDEICRKEDQVAAWVKARKDDLIIPTEHALPFLTQVLAAYGIFSETDIEIFDGKADPFLIAEGLASGATIVTNEKSNPGAISIRKKKIPDICRSVGVECMRYPRFLWEMTS